MIKSATSDGIAALRGSVRTLNRGSSGRCAVKPKVKMRVEKMRQIYDGGNSSVLEAEGMEAPVKRRVVNRPSHASQSVQYTRKWAQPGPDRHSALFTCAAGMIPQKWGSAGVVSSPPTKRPPANFPG